MSKQWLEIESWNAVSLLFKFLKHGPLSELHCVLSPLISYTKQMNYYYVLPIIHFSESFISFNWRPLHVIQALNGNKCNAYFVSGKIKEFFF